MPPQQGLQPKAASSLVAGLQSLAPAQNPQTPNSRQDPTTVIRIDNERIRISLERALENVTDPTIKAIFEAVHGAMTSIIGRIDPNIVKSVLLQSLGGAGPSSPQMSVPGLPAATPSLAPGPAQAPIAPPPQMGGMMGNSQPPPMAV